jgi:class 3 adenylate cyclase
VTVTSPTRWWAPRSTLGARLESLAPAGGVLIGAETYGRLPPGALVEATSGLIKGKADAIHACVLFALP